MTKQAEAGSLPSDQWRVSQCDDGVWMVHTEGDILAYAAQGDSEAKARAVCAAMNAAKAINP